LKDFWIPHGHEEVDEKCRDSMCRAGDDGSDFSNHVMRRGGESCFCNHMVMRGDEWHFWTHMSVRRDNP
jgi:hypothetical protein